MQGVKAREGKLFYRVSLEKLVPPDHFLRKLDEVISLEWVRRETRRYYSHTGRPSVDPVVLVKMLIIGYLYDIRSERRLVEEISLNLAYRWYVGYDLDEDVPNHSVFSKARRRFGKGLFVKIFREILKECVKAGLVTGETVFVDSTVVRADASMDSMVEVNLSPERYWRELDEEEKRRGTRGRKPTGDSQFVGKKSQGEIDVKKMGRRRRRRKSVYLLKRSKTDPDATFHFRPGIGGFFSYKAHFSTTREGIITGVCVSPSSDHDTVKLQEMIRGHTLGAGFPKSVVADSMYGTEEALGYLQNLGIATYIQPMGTKNRPGFLPKEEFKYDEEKDCYICPAGAVLRRKKKSRKTHQVRYAANKEDCAGCPLKDRCVSSKTGARMVTRYDSDYRERAKKWCSTSRGKRLLILRKTVIEGVIAQAKFLHGLGRAKYRGLWRVEIQALLTATVINMKKLVEERGRRASKSAWERGYLTAACHPKNFSPKTLFLCGL
jgi:transposase